MSDAESPTNPRSTALRVMLAILVVHGIAFAISEFTSVYEDKPRWQRLFDAGAFLPLQIGSMLALFHAARRAELPRGTRRGLRFMGAAFAVIALGSLVWLVMESRGTPLVYISWADLIFFQFYPFLILGLWSLPVATRPPGSRQDMVGWAIVMIVFGSLIAFAAGVDAQAKVLSPGMRALVVLTSSAQLVTLMMINRAIERAKPTPSAHALSLLLGALGLSVMGDLVFQVLFSTGYTGMNWSIGAAVLTNFMVVLAAIRFIEDPVREPPTAESPRVSFSPLPIIAVSALALMLVWMASRSVVSGLGPLLIGLVIVNALLVVRDARASRAAAELVRAGAQRDATRRVEALVRHSSDAILLLDPEGRLLFASAPADHLFAAPVTSLLGSPFADVFPEADRSARTAFFDELRESGGRPVTFVSSLTRPSDGERMIECVGLDLRDEPAIGGFVIHSRDITDRVHLEERLLQSQKLEVAGRLAGGVAHDFNNVLTAVIAGAELARMSLEPDHPAVQDLHGVEAAAQRGAALTRRLLAFVRQEPVPAQSVDVRAMLLDVEPLLGRLAGDPNVVSMRVPDTLGTVLVDRTELEHIIFNLVANARDATPMGGPIEVSGDLVVLTEAPAGAIIAPTPGRFVRIAIADRGHGMADDVRRRMFDPFFTQKTGGRGSGLGLIGVRPLVEGAGGGLAVESAAGSGTRVNIYLPCESGAAAGPPRQSSPLRTPSFGVRAVPAAYILLVEDELEVREQLTRLLEALGFAAIATASAAEARAVLASDPRPVRAVVSDVIMPGETGIEFAQWLRANHPDLPILLISGHTGTALDRGARTSDDFDLLRKPFTGAALAERLEAMLGPRNVGAAASTD